MSNKSLNDKKRKFNKIHSLQFRILATIIIAMLAITVFVGGISIYEVDQYIQNESENFVVVTCDNEGAQINNLFEDMEKSVTVMESYIMDFFTEEVLIEDQDFQENVINSVDKMFSDVAKHVIWGCFTVKQKKVMMNTFLLSQLISRFMKKTILSMSDGFGNLTKQESLFGCHPTTTKTVTYI